jgi:hypothetical protein
MNITLYWEKTLFINRFTFFVKNEKVGRYSYGLFKDNAEGQLLNIRLKFKKRGWFKSKSDIIETTSNTVIGTIDLKKGLFKNKAVVVINGKTYKWEHSSVWSGKWELIDGEQVRVKGNNNRLKGIYEIVDADVPLILSSMYISRNFKDSNSAFTLVIVLPPILKFIANLF